ncbi:MAG: hypothetical protein IPF68_15000, partial [Bacteroidales bacterium]|nr:hypothetical protein [Bacteroidales bacterium]
NTADGIAQGKAIRTLTDELKAEEKALGDTRRNVGNYTDSIIEANQQMGLSGTILGKAISGYKAFKVAALEASGGTSVLNGAMKLLAANPVFAIIAIIAGVFMLLKEAIGKNAEIVDKFTVALAPLKVILGVVFGIIGDFVELLVGGFAKGMELITNLFGDAGNAADEYAKSIQAVQQAEDDLYNLRIRQKTEQKAINDLMAVADNRLVQGKARYEALKKAIDIQIETVKEEARLSEILHTGKIKQLESEYNLRGQLVEKNGQLTQMALNKLSDEKEAYKTSLDNLLDAKNRESEIYAASARKIGTQLKAQIADEKAARDLQIAAMTDGLGKQLATIESNYTAQRETIKVSFQEQFKLIENAYKDQVKLQENQN